jgi:sugar O-acyltransferase (sialic acid O-acetyltransferase NeuD family)
MKKIVVIGAGGNAREVAAVLRDINEYEVVGFLTDQRSEHDSPVLGNFDWPAVHPIDEFAMGIGDPIAKYHVARNLCERYPGIAWPVIVHPTAYIGSSVKLSRGAIACVRAIATTNIEIGDFTQLNFGCTLGHDTQVGPACLINPGANISGGVRLGRSVMVGTGAQVLQYLTIGDEARIGPGAVVTSDVEPNTTVVGVPANAIFPKATPQTQ